MSDRVHVLFLGSAYWCRQLAGLVSTRDDCNGYTKSEWKAWLKHSNRRLVLVGFGVPNTWRRKVYFALARAMRGLGLVPTPVMLWIGSDTLSLPKTSHSLSSYRHVAGSEWLASEVKQQGYDCATALFPVALDHLEPMPMPTGKRLQILCYIPDAFSDTHGGNGIVSAARSLPDCDFTVLGGAGSWLEDIPDNMRFTGWTDNPKEYLKASHVLVRNTPHDSLSAFVREGLVVGRYVVFTHEYPGVITIPSNDESALTMQLARLQEQLVERGLELQQLDSEVEYLLRNVDEQVARMVDCIK